jgi:DNA-binding transcriptional LysR family regulator
MSSGDRASAIEIRHLIAFSAVADESSFSRAAERLGYTRNPR